MYIRHDYHLRRLTHALLVAVALCSFLIVPAHGDDVRAKAMAGEPFGFAEVSFPIDEACEQGWHCRAIHLEEANGRILYPILEHAGLLQRLASRMSGDGPTAPPRASISFLFVGSEPLDLTLNSSQSHRLTVVPEPNNPRKHARMGRAWWNRVWGPVGDRINDGSRPRPVENFVAGMGIHRLGINRHAARHTISAGTIEEMVIGTARMRADMARAVSFGWSDQGTADRPLLPPLAWKTVQLPARDDVKIEDIAYRAPGNCFYLRFAKFTNMLWSLRLIESNGEELQRLITTRGFRVNAGEKIQEQLAVKELPFADLIGDTLIDDVALVGRDLFLADGAALGVILRVKNPLFTTGLKSVRSQAVKKMKEFGATSETVQIEGKDVQLISTPDNRLRSYHVIDGKWQMLTNSRAIAASFLRTGKKEEPSLADSPTFQKLREEMPPDRGDTLFAYVPTEFFKAFTRPEYVIELQRRTRARAELSLLEIARLAAKRESLAFAGAGRDAPVDGSQGDDVISGLRSRGLLPPGFGVRADGSHPVWIEGDGSKDAGVAVDSLRGGVGTFLPVPDVEINKATQEENRVYQRFVNAHAGQWSSIDPIMFRLRKHRLKDKPGRDRLEIDARVTPLQPTNASILLGILGKHRTERMRPDKDALMTAEAMISSNWVPTRIDTHAQLTVFDGPRVEPADSARLADILALAQRVPARLLVEPARSAFDRRWWREAVPTPQGEFLYGPFNLIGRRMSDHAAIAFDQNQLLNTPSKVDWERLESPAQAWLHIVDLEGTSIEDAVASLAASRGMSGSIKNAQFYHQWTELLGVPTAEGQSLTRKLVGMDPVCPLGGDYVLEPDAAGHEHWRSSCWATDSMSSKDLPDYYPSLLRWCHGIDASIDLEPQGLHLAADVEVDFAERDEERSKPAAKKDEESKGTADEEVAESDKKAGKGGFQLPFSLFGGDKKPAAQEPNASPATEEAEAK